LRIIAASSPPALGGYCARLTDIAHERSGRLPTPKNE
jgi:hypothetical protein